MTVVAIVEQKENSSFHFIVAEVAPENTANIQQMTVVTLGEKRK